MTPEGLLSTADSILARRGKYPSVVRMPWRNRDALLSRLEQFRDESTHDLFIFAGTIKVEEHDVERLIEFRTASGEVLARVMVTDPRHI